MPTNTQPTTPPTAGPAPAITPDSLLGDLVTTDVRRAKVMEGLGLDYCCGGQQTLGDASQAAGLDLEAVTQALTLADAEPGTAPTPATPSDLATLGHEIIDTHHAYLWEEMPRLKGLVDKIVQVHGANHAELAEVQRIYTEAIDELDGHLAREERFVFPAINRMERTQAPVQAQGRPLQELLDELAAEHDVVGDMFARMGELTGGYETPADGCPTYHATLSGLQAMEHDLHMHIHKENNILFPRAAEMARQLA